MILAKKNSPQISATNPRFFYKTLAAASKILYPQYPCYFFPSFLLIQVYNKLVALKNNPKYRVVPLPNKLYSALCKREPYQCDHFCFVSDELYDKYLSQHKLNWINLLTTNGNDSINNKRSNSMTLVPVISVEKCQRNCVFVSENCYQNWCIKSKIHDGQPLFVGLQNMTAEQYVPRLANRATVFLIKNPHELPLDVTDEIITNYFTTPRILYRNHTYEIVLDEQQVGTTLYSQFLHIFTNLRKLYFRCVHLESSDYAFENFCVVAKGVTALHQSTSINFPITRQYLDELCFVSACPWGLMRHFNELKSCVLPFIGASMVSPSAASSPSLAREKTSSGKASGGKRVLSNRIFPAFLVQGDRGAGKRRIVGAVANSLGFQQYSVDCAEIASQIPAQTEAKLKLALAKANICEPIFFILSNFELFGVDNEGREDVRVLTMFQKELHSLFAKERTYPIVLIALANSKIMKPIIQSQFLETISLDAPNKHERFNNLQWLFHREIIMQELHNSERVDCSDIPLWNGRSIKSAKYQIARHYKCARNLHCLEEAADKGS